MIDTYLFLTPILMLGVMALVRFVGCNVVFGVKDTVLKVDPPESVEAVPADRRIQLSWFYPIGKATGFKVNFGEQMGGPYPNIMNAAPSQASLHGSPVTSLMNGTTYYFKVTAVTATGESDLSDSQEVPATPGVTDFVLKDQQAKFGPLRSDHDGCVGMAIQVGSDAVTITQLGRIVAPGNVNPHKVMIVDPGHNNAELGFVTLVMPAAPIDEFAYLDLVPPVMLAAFGLYYIVSQETNGGDAFYDISSKIIETTGVAVVRSAVYNYGQPGQPPFTFVGSEGQMTYVPVNFRY